MGLFYALVSLAGAIANKDIAWGVTLIISQMWLIGFIFYKE